MQVAAPARGQGIGTRLVETAEAMAQEAGLDSIAIGVSVDNVAARRLYERLGYGPTDILEVSNYVYVDPEGASHLMTETNTLLIKPLGRSRPDPAK